MSGSLEGIAVGIPAARRAEETAELVRRWGGVPVVGPTMREVAAEDDRELRTATAEVIETGAGWSVHLTGVGTARWFAAAESWGLLADLLGLLGAARVVARGPKAARVLRGQGLEPHWMPAGETSGEIGEWLTPRLVPGDAVALQRHGEPVPTLARAIEEVGARVIEVATYRWELPADPGPAEALVSAIAGGEVQALVVTSAPQARFLFRIARGLRKEEELRRALDERVFVAAVGPTAAAGVEAEGVKADLVAERGRLGLLVRELAASRELILVKWGG